MDDVAIPPAAPEPVLPIDYAASSTPTRRNWVWARWAAVVLSIAALLYVGMEFRWWHWDFTDPIHFDMDMQNALRWGRAGVQHGYLNVYDTVVRDHPEEVKPNYMLDYSPLRLAVFTAWARWMDAAHPDVRVWVPDYDVNRPLLWFNTFMEIASAVVAGMLVYTTRRRAGRKYAVPLAVLAGAFLWLNPQLLISSWGRPAWEVWVLPFYLGAMWLAADDKWLASGAVAGVGIMLKGQIGVVIPVFLLWPLFGWRPLNTARWAAGFLCAAALVVSPWMLTKPGDPNAPLLVRSIDAGAVAWLVFVYVGITFVLMSRWQPPRRYPRLADVAALVAVAIFGVPIILVAYGYFGPKTISPKGAAFAIGAIPAAAAGAAALLRYAPWRVQPVTIAGIVAAALFSCVGLFHGGMNWYRVGFEYGANKFEQLDLGGSTSIAAILSTRYKLKGTDAAWTFEPRSILNWPATTTVLTVEQTLSGLYVLALIAAAYGLNHLHRRRDPRWLVAVTMPWLVYFAVAPRMHERYLFWAAAVGSVVVGTDVGLSLLVVVISIISWANTATVLFDFARYRADGLKSIRFGWFPDFGTWTIQAIHQASPDLGWAVLICALVFVYQTVRPAPKPADLLSSEPSWRPWLRRPWSRTPARSPSDGAGGYLPAASPEPTSIDRSLG